MSETKTPPHIIRMTGVEPATGDAFDVEHGANAFVVALIDDVSGRGRIYVMGGSPANMVELVERIVCDCLRVDEPSTTLGILLGMNRFEAGGGKSQMTKGVRNLKGDDDNQDTPAPVDNAAGPTEGRG